MGDLIFTDFKAKNRQYTKGGGIDDLKCLPEEDTSPCEMPPVQPDYTGVARSTIGGNTGVYSAPDKDSA